MTKVKICGVTDPRTAAFAVAAGASAVGIVFVPGRRQVTPVAAWDIIRACSPTPVVGVFADEPLQALIDAVRRTGIELVQLHGRESPQYCRFLRQSLGVEVIKAFFVGVRPPCVHDYQVGVDVDYLLYDSAGPGSGGTGQMWDWSLVRGAPRPLILAGGLDPGNVGRAIVSVRPDWVDVSSGVETDGRKDPEKIRAFLQRVRAAETIGGEEHEILLAR